MIRVDYAGPGGSCEGLRLLGLETVGFEWDAAACATRAAAGHVTVRADLATYRPRHPAGSVQGYWASPPCQTFSAAGAGAGRSELGALVRAVDLEDWDAADRFDPRTRHVIDAARTAIQLHPEWVGMEQVPAVRPVFDALARRLHHHGYSTWVGVLNSADFGVPQTRRRAILLASRVRTIHPPEPTHGPDPTPGLFSDLAPWVSMAEALGWPDTWAVEGRRGAGMIERHGDRPPTPATQPYPTLTGGENRRRWVVDHRTNSKGAAGTIVPTVPVPMTRPAPTFTSQAGGQWCFDRPATTVCADPRLGEPGHRDRDGGEPQFKPDAIKLTVQEALILQSFRPDYPVQGPKSKQFEQVGNAVPPVLAAHCASALTGTPVAPLAAKDPS